MKFVLQIWPDIEDGEGATPRDYLVEAIYSASTNPELNWDILNDDDTVLAKDVSIAHGQAAADDGS